MFLYYKIIVVIFTIICNSNGYILISKSLRRLCLASNVRQSSQFNVPWSQMNVPWNQKIVPNFLMPFTPFAVINNNETQQLSNDLQGYSGSNSTSDYTGRKRDREKFTFLLKYGLIFSC